MSIKQYTTQLRLPYIRTHYEEAIKEAHLQDWNHEQFLEELLKRETELRTSNSINRRIREAHFPYRITLEEYRRDHLSVEIRQKIKELEIMGFIEKDNNIILIGNPGTGKTALAIALGMEACQREKNVLFISVPNLLMELKEAMSLNQITLYKKKFERYDLVILDELGYCTFDQERGEILFNLLSNRNENGSMIITSNLTFDRWNEVFRDQVLTGAIIDRLAYRSHLIDMTGESYRIIATKKWKNESEKDVT